MSVIAKPAGIDSDTMSLAVVDPVLKAWIESGAPTSVAPSSGALTNRSGTITLGGAAQAVAAANPSRKYFIFENVSDTDMWLNFGSDAVATQPSFLIKANGGSIVQEASFVSTQSVSVLCATTGKAFTAKEA